MILNWKYLNVIKLHVVATDTTFLPLIGDIDLRMVYSNAPRNVTFQIK